MGEDGEAQKTHVCALRSVGMHYLCSQGEEMGPLPAAEYAVGEAESVVALLLQSVAPGFVGGAAGSAAYGLRAGLKAAKRRGGGAWVVVALMGATAMRRWLTPQLQGSPAGSEALLLHSAHPLQEEDPWHTPESTADPGRGAPEPERNVPMLADGPATLEEMLEDLATAQQKYSGSFYSDFMKPQSHAVVLSLSVALALKALYRVAWHITYLHLGSSDPEVHADSLDEMILQLQESPHLDPEDLIFDAQSRRPHRYLGFLYRSPYIHMLLKTLANLEQLQHLYALSYGDIEELHAYWFALTSGEREQVLGWIPRLAPSSAQTPLLLSSAQRIFYVLQSWDYHWAESYGAKEEVVSPFTRISEREIQALGPTHFSTTLRSALETLKGFHGELIKQAQLSLDEEQLATLKHGYYSLYMETFADLYQIHHASRKLLKGGAGQRSLENSYFMQAH